MVTPNENGVRHIQVTKQRSPGRRFRSTTSLKPATFHIPAGHSESYESFCKTKPTQRPTQPNGLFRHESAQPWYERCRTLRSKSFRSRHPRRNLPELRNRCWCATAPAQRLEPQASRTVPLWPRRVVACTTSSITGKACVWSYWKSRLDFENAGEYTSQ